MRFLFSSTVGLLVTILNLPTAIASEWKYIAADEGVRYYYNTSAFKKVSNNQFLVVIKEKYTGIENNGIEEVLLLEEINCYHKNYRNKSMTSYYVDKTINTVDFGDSEWSDVQYGTNQFDIIAQVCSDAKVLKPYLTKNVPSR